MYRIIRNPKRGHVVEVTINGRTTDIDLEHKNRGEISKLNRQLWEWRKSGYVGYPELST